MKLGMGCLVAGIASCWLLSATAVAEELIGIAAIPGTERDRSGLSEPLDKDVPHDLLGGFSAIDYTGSGSRYCVLSDRGPGDGKYAYSCRVHYVDIDLQPGAERRLNVKLQSTGMLRDGQGRTLSGSTAAFAGANAEQNLRFDPEGLRLGPAGEIYISDEYGPTVSQFNSSGVRNRVFPIPARFAIAHPAVGKVEEAVANHSGRQPNKGMEGLAIVPSGGKLVGALQGPLIQESLDSEKGKRNGVNVRLVQIDLTSGSTREFLYPLDSQKNGICEILAINDQDFLLIERDGSPGGKAKYKKIIKASIAGATDISGIELPANSKVPKEIKPVKKSVLIDLLDPRHGLAGESFPEKVEGLTFGPTLADGRRLLIVCVDNDFKVDKPSLVYAFAIEQEKLAGFGWKR